MNGLLLRTCTKEGEGTYWVLFSFQLLLQFTQSHGGALQLDKGNFDSIIGKRNCNIFFRILKTNAVWICIVSPITNVSITVIEERMCFQKYVRQTRVSTAISYVPLFHCIIVCLQQSLGIPSTTSTTPLFFLYFLLYSFYIILRYVHISHTFSSIHTCLLFNYCGLHTFFVFMYLLLCCKSIVDLDMKLLWHDSIEYCMSCANISVPITGVTNSNSLLLGILFILQRGCLLCSYNKLVSSSNTVFFSIVGSTFIRDIIHCNFSLLLTSLSITLSCTIFISQGCDCWHYFHEEKLLTLPSWKVVCI